MKNKIKYRESDYFNTEDTFIFYHPATDRLLVSKVEKENGNWFCLEGLKFKCTSVPCLRFSDIKGNNIAFCGFRGKIIKPSPKINCLGMHWNQGQKGIPNFWNNINHLKWT